MGWVVSLSTAKLISRGPTAALDVVAFGVWLGWVTAKAPRTIQCSTSTTHTRR